LSFAVGVSGKKGGVTEKTEKSGIFRSDRAIENEEGTEDGRYLEHETSKKRLKKRRWPFPLKVEAGGGRRVGKRGRLEEALTGVGR